MTQSHWRAALALCLSFAAALPGQGHAADYEKKCASLLAEAGQRHLRLGSWARDQGLVPQATAQFLRAVEVCEGHNPGAMTVLSVMRDLGDAFWKQRRKKPSKALLAEFDKRAAAAETKNRADHLELAQRAAAADLTPQARRHYRKVLELGGELARDDKGVWRIEGKKIEGALAEWLKGETRDDRQGRPLFEAAGSAAPRLRGLVVHEDEQLQVRTDLPGDAAAKLHALGRALFPHLRERLEGAPSRRLVLTVFRQHADYVAYLTARGMADGVGGLGLADYGTFQTLVSSQAADGSPLAEPDLHALLLHELSHLYFFAVAPAVMPDWFAEGFAETFGGQGTFTWDGAALKVGGLMHRQRIDAVKAAVIPLRELVDLRAGALLARDKDKAALFYAQCWALHRYLMQPDCPWHARLEFFEAKCRGLVLGAPEGGQRAPNQVPASVLFQQLFAEDLAQLDAAFRAWLAHL